MVTRSQWGADSSCIPRASPAYGEVLGTVVHHTLSTNRYSRAEAASVVLGICRYHRNSNGWNDIGYNVLIDRFGTIYEGRAGGVQGAVIGAHSQGFNSQTAGIALLGSHVSSAPSMSSLAALQRVVKWKLALAGVTRQERVGLISAGGPHSRFPVGRLVFVRPVSGHRDLDSTACPGGALYSRLPGLATYLTPGSRTATRMSLRVERDPAGGAVISGRLRGAGKNLSGKEIEVQAYTATGWIRIGGTRTNENGIWMLSFTPTVRQHVRGVYAGSGTLRPVRSPSAATPKPPAAP
jgi:uncharacterized protein with LGFP repeats